jgi:hypothetical protein
MVGGASCGSSVDELEGAGSAAHLPGALLPLLTQVGNDKFAL